MDKLPGDRLGLDDSDGEIRLLLSRGESPNSAMQVTDFALFTRKQAALIRTACESHRYQ